MSDLSARFAELAASPGPDHPNGAGQVAKGDGDLTAVLDVKGGGISYSGHSHDIISFSSRTEPDARQPRSPKVKPNPFNMTAKVPFGRSPRCPGTVVKREP